MRTKVAGERGTDRSLASYLRLLSLRGNCGIRFRCVRFGAGCGRTDKAQITVGLSGGRPHVPGDLLHFFLGGQALVFIEGALAHGKEDFALDIESPAKDFLFRSAESGDDMAPSATATQRLTTFRSSSFYCQLNHGSLFSKKRVALRLTRWRADEPARGARFGKPALQDPGCMRALRRECHVDECDVSGPICQLRILLDSAEREGD